MLCVAPPLSRNVGGNRVRGVEGHSLTRVVTERAEHRREVGNIALNERGRNGEGEKEKMQLKWYMYFVSIGLHTCTLYMATCTCM